LRSRGTRILVVAGRALPRRHLDAQPRVGLTLRFFAGGLGRVAHHHGLGIHRALLLFAHQGSVAKVAILLVLAVRVLSTLAVIVGTRANAFNTFIRQRTGILIVARGRIVRIHATRGRVARIVGTGIEVVAVVVGFADGGNDVRKVRGKIPWEVSGKISWEVSGKISWEVSGKIPWDIRHGPSVDDVPGGIPVDVRHIPHVALCLRAIPPTSDVDQQCDQQDGSR